MALHMNTVAGNEMLVLDSARRYPNATFFGLTPGAIKSNIRSNWLGANSFKHRIFEWVIGLISQSADTYGSRSLSSSVAAGLSPPDDRRCCVPRPLSRCKSTTVVWCGSGARFA